MTQSVTKLKEVIKEKDDVVYQISVTYTTSITNCIDRYCCNISE